MNRPRLRNIGLTLALGFMIIIAFLPTPASAVTGNQLWQKSVVKNSVDCAASPITFTFTGAAVTVAVNDFVYANIYLLTDQTTVSTVTDSLGNAWSFAYDTAVGSVGRVAVYYTSVTVSGTMSSITVRWVTAPTTACQVQVTAADSGALVVADTPIIYSTTLTTALIGCGTTGLQNPDCGTSGVLTAPSKTFDAGDLAVIIVTGECKHVSSTGSTWHNAVCLNTVFGTTPTVDSSGTGLGVNVGLYLQTGNVGNPCNNPVDNATPYNAFQYFATGASKTYSTQFVWADTFCSTNIPETYPNAKLTYNTHFVVLHFVQSGRVTITTTVTSTVSTATTVLGDGTISTLASELLKRRLYFAQGQNNINVVATPYNLTAKVSRISINTTTTTVFLAVYAVTASAETPTASNPLVLLYSKGFTLSNGTTNSLLSTLIPLGNNINGYSFYAVGLFATSSKSNSGTLTSSGVIMFQATSPLGTWRDFAVPTNTIPNNFYTGTASAFSPYAYVRLQYPVGIVVSTTTATASATTVITQTSTIFSTNVLNSIDPAKVNNWIMPAFFILFFLGLFSAIGLALKRTTGMFYARSGKI